jgi:phage-related protein
MRLLSTNIKLETVKLGVIPRSLYYLEILDKATGATSVIRHTNHHSDITFQGDTYTAYDSNHGSIKTYLKNQVDNCSITIDNVDKVMSANFAYNEFAGQKAEVYKVFLDSTGTIIDGYTAWAASAVKSIDDIVEPTTPNGLSYTCTAAGTTSGSEPTWPTTIGGTVVDGGVTWECTGTNDDRIIQFTGFMDRPKITERQVNPHIVSAFDRSQSFAPWQRFTAKCNWRFCQTECGYNSAAGEPRGVVDTGSAGGSLTDTELVGTSSMIGGTCKILSGANKNASRKIATHNTTTGHITFDSDFSNSISAGDTYIVECDKSKSTCESFSNEPNFGGFEETYHSTSWVVIMK